MDHSLISQPGPLQLVYAFGWGFISSLTPCVYPLIPLTVALFGAKTENSRLQSFLLSLVYVLGIAVTYTALGIFAAKSGLMFGSALGNIYLVVPVVLIFFWFGLYSLDIFHPKWISRIQNTASKLGGKGYRGAFTMGLASGIVAAPCVGPALVVILGVVASAGNVFWGGILLFVYALGFGMLFIAVASFSQFFSRLPKSGSWLFFPKFLIAAALFLVGLYLIRPFFNTEFELVLTTLSTPLCFLAAISVFAIGFIADKKQWRFLKLFCAIALSIVCLRLVVPSTPSELNWHKSIEQGLQTAQQGNQLVMVDMYADWCAACIEFDLKTFSDKSVQQNLQNFTLVKLDFTIPDEISEALMEKYDVVGLPCILFLNADGSEVDPDLRITGFLNPEHFNNFLAKIQKASVTKKTSVTQ